MRILFCFVLIIISSFAHASDFTYQHYVFQFNKLARELKAARTLPTLDTEQGKEILNKLTDPNLFRLYPKINWMIIRVFWMKHLKLIQII